MKFAAIFGVLVAFIAFLGCFTTTSASRDARPVQPRFNAPPPKPQRPIIYDTPIRRPGPKTMYA
ncbi:uncharacterized protein LOC111676957 [Lucilia cuprina]|uniref:uncharacterized protein LOC111676957 n=1 Tax=Lucilia cuprina TaxID=7375 RepID=UPI000C71B202|nr:uncharacterized protein LOC111676957 [Lucilia cuprina]KAI8128708.1 hypothetical protein CVS40_1899 [Lucilia cuprina]